MSIFPLFRGFGRFWPVSKHFNQELVLVWSSWTQFLPCLSAQSCLWALHTYFTKSRARIEHEMENSVNFPDFWPTIWPLSFYDLSEGNSKSSNWSGQWLWLFVWYKLIFCDFGPCIEHKMCLVEKLSGLILNYFRISAICLKARLWMAIIKGFCTVSSV